MSYMPAATEPALVGVQRMGMARMPDLLHGCLLRQVAGLPLAGFAADFALASHEIQQQCNTNVTTNGSEIFEKF
jgi:hypothetical protein